MTSCLKYRLALRKLMNKKLLSIIFLVFVSHSALSHWNDIQFDNSDSDSGYKFSITIFTHSGKYCYRSGKIDPARLYPEVTKKDRLNPNAYPSGFYTVITDHKPNEKDFAYKKDSHVVLNRYLPGDTQRIVIKTQKINDSNVTGSCELLLSENDMDEIISRAGSVGIKIINGVPSISTYW